MNGQETCLGPYGEFRSITCDLNFGILLNPLLYFGQSVEGVCFDPRLVARILPHHQGLMLSLKNIRNSRLTLKPRSAILSKSRYLLLEFSDLSKIAENFSHLLDHLDNAVSLLSKSGVNTPRTLVLHPNPIISKGWVALRHSLVYFRGQPVGAIAALDGADEKVNYGQDLKQLNDVYRFKTEGMDSIGFPGINRGDAFKDGAATRDDLGQFFYSFWLQPLSRLDNPKLKNVPLNIIQQANMSWEIILKIRFPLLHLKFMTRKLPSDRVFRSHLVMKGIHLPTVLTPRSALISVDPPKRKLCGLDAKAKWKIIRFQYPCHSLARLDACHDRQRARDDLLRQVVLPLLVLTGLHFACLNRGRDLAGIFGCEGAWSKPPTTRAPGPSLPPPFSFCDSPSAGCLYWCRVEIENRIIKDLNVASGDRRRDVRLARDLPWFQLLPHRMPRVFSL
ncbi:hypothetical protein VNO77_37271 [Canavalia gladiata]|uniref:Uncharacterized protein n=1 Tax=Canavalia gladiata TaxID=3824 RepID=A0AAN9KAC8_CANGL